MLEGPFRGSDVVAAGVLSRRQLYGPRYQRVFPDIYAPAALTLDLAERSRAAYLLVRGRGGVLAGYSAAELLGAGCAPANARAEVLMPRYLRAYPGLRVRYEHVGWPDLAMAGVCVVTAPPRTAWDLARRLSLVEAVVAVDALARTGAFEPVELLARRAERSGARGCRRLDRVVALA